MERGYRGLTNASQHGFIGREVEAPANSCSVFALVGERVAATQGLSEGLLLLRGSHEPNQFAARGWHPKPRGVILSNVP